MLSFDIKRKINTLRDILVGKVPDPKAQVEQITIALIYKFMDDMDLSGLEFGGERVFFAGDYQKYAFSQIMLSENSAQERLNLYAEGIDKMTNNPELPQLFRDILRNTYIPYRDPETLNRFLKEIADFSYDDSEDLGNAFEYLLSIMGSQGDAGQFRTPRHIIDMMVEIIEPQKNESILDPACGTAGFLISAYNYIKNHNVDEYGNSTLTADDRNRINANFAGYDISPDMVRLSRVNMYLHRFSNPNISEYDTLTSLDKWEDKYDVIFANPPFMTPKGGIVPHSRYQVSAKRAEVLFVDYIAEHLLENGRAAVIVPEGIVFQSQTAYKQLRDMLIKEYLYAVISLPAGVFNPYSGVKTSILIMDMSRAKKQDSILFVKLNNDGYDLGAQRREIKGSEIPDVLNIFRDYKAGKDVSDRPNVVVAKKEDIKKQDYILVGERYRENEIKCERWESVKIEEVCQEIKAGFPCGKTSDDCEGVLHIRPMNITPDGRFTEIGSKYISQNDFSEVYAVKSGDILFNNTNSKELVGKTCLFDKNIKAGYSNHITRIRVNETILPKFLALILQHMYENGVFLDLCNKWVGQAAINSKVLSNLEIPLPPLTVQQEIVDEIESYQRIIDGARQVVDNYKPTIKVEEGWESYTLGDVCDILNGSTPLKTEEEYWNSNDIPWFTVDDIRMQGRRIYQTQKYISKKALEQTGVKLLPPKTVLLCCTASVGEYAIAEIPLTTNQQFNGLVIKKEFQNKLLPDYLFYYADNFKKDMERLGGHTAFKFISVNEAKKISVCFPDIDAQSKIVKQLDDEILSVSYTERLIEIFQQKIADKIAEVWGE